MKFSVKSYPHLWGQINFSSIFEKIEKSIYLIVFKLRDRFWTLWDGPLDPLDRYNFFNEKIDFSIKSYIFQYFAYKPILGSFKVGFDPLEL